MNRPKIKPRTEPDAAAHAAVYAIEAGLEKLVAAMGATRDAVALKGAEAKPLTGKNQRITFVPGRILGFAVHETAGSNAVITMRDGSAAAIRILDGEGGQVVVPISLAPGESAREWWGPGGVAVTAGVYLEVTGEVEGSIFVGTD